MSRNPERPQAPPAWMNALRRSLGRHLAEVRAEEAREAVADALERIADQVKRRPKP